jgi:hypothetical protein
MKHLEKEIPSEQRPTAKVSQS